MDVPKYLTEDLRFIENLVIELRDNVTKWSPAKVFDKTDVLFATFHNRFSTEDFLIRHMCTTAETQETLREFLNIRSGPRKSASELSFVDQISA